MALFGSGVERFQTASLVLHHALVILDTGDLQSIAVVRHERQKGKRGTAPDCIEPRVCNAQIWQAQICEVCESRQRADVLKISLQKHLVLCIT